VNFCCPRPCGRGGFKLISLGTGAGLDNVPAHAGGVDLSWQNITIAIVSAVPAHAGGVDLSWDCVSCVHSFHVPAHAGGVDLSFVLLFPSACRSWSPPMRAGWI